MVLIQVSADEAFEKVVGSGGDVGRVYINKKYIGRKVLIVIPSANNDCGGNNNSCGGGGVSCAEK